MGTISAMNDYYNEIPKANERFYEALQKNNISGRFCGLLTMCKDLLLIDDQKTMECGRARSAARAAALNKVVAYIRSIEDISIVVLTKQIQYEYCCSQKMLAIPEKSELYCNLCGRLDEIKGMVFEDSQFYSQEGKKPKHSKYTKMRTFHKWMRNTMAREIPKMTRDEYRLLDTCVARDGFGKPGEARGIPITKIRQYMHDVGLAKYNTFASYILSYYTGVRPPQLNASEYELVEKTYLEVLSVCAKNATYTNTPYAPFFIWKIIEDKFAGNAEVLRIRQYIHLQSEDTVTKQDYIWFRYCDHKGIRKIDTVF
jgi:hypothetical protein